MKLKIIIGLFFVLTSISAQNLVLNPSFEKQNKADCSEHLGNFNNRVIHWSTPNGGSSDLFSTCSKKMGVFNFNGKQNPKSGQYYAGIYAYSDKSYREYLQGQLQTTLLKGETYTMTFYISLADLSSYALKDLNVMFTEEKLKPNYRSSNYDKVIKPKKVTSKKYALYADSRKSNFSEKANWQKFTFDFVAQGYENYFSIGNFKRNAKTPKIRVLSSSPYFFSYYYIDDVSVQLKTNNTVEKVKPSIKKEQISDSIKTNKIYRFKTVLFDFDKAELLELSKTELNTLLEYLEKNKKSKIEIYGHTDNVGLVKRNDELSRLRAKAVADYLILKGVRSSRVSYKGFGSKQPIATNETEAGRQQNRRVEFKLSK